MVADGSYRSSGSFVCFRDGPRSVLQQLVSNLPWPDCGSSANIQSATGIESAAGFPGPSKQSKSCSSPTKNGCCEYHETTFRRFGKRFCDQATVA